MFQAKFLKFKDVLVRFEEDNSQEDFWDVDLMLRWVDQNPDIQSHPGLPAFITFWADTDIWLLLTFAVEFASRYPGKQPLFDDLDKYSDFDKDKSCWLVLN